jgi:hypothetical protein
MLLPAWVSIATVRTEMPYEHLKLNGVQTLTVLYHVTQRKMNIKRETSASINVFSIASFISMSSLLLQLHLTRANDPVVPLFHLLRKGWAFLSSNFAVR